MPKPTQAPEKQLSKEAIEKRLRRVFQPRRDGTYVVSQDWVDKFNNKGADRESLLAMFEKVGYNPDRGLQTTVNKRSRYNVAHGKLPAFTNYAH